MRLSFVKYEGAGNDFLLMDHRLLRVPLRAAEIAMLCDRRRGVGADGVLLIEADAATSFRVRYMNADGSESFCANGARCAAHWASENGLSVARFNATQGPTLRASVEDKDVAVYWTENTEVTPYEDGYFVKGKTPHFVREVKNLDQYAVCREGRRLRMDTRRFPKGVNVNFVAEDSDPEAGFRVRTYERGVEDETWACGTGAVAVARVMAQKYGNKSPFSIHMRGGTLSVRLMVESSEVMLSGKVRPVYQGSISLFTSLKNGSDTI